MGMNIYKEHFSINSILFNLIPHSGIKDSYHSFLKEPLSSLWFSDKIQY